MSQDPMADAYLAASETVRAHEEGQEARIRELVREEVAGIPVKDGFTAHQVHQIQEIVRLGILQIMTEAQGSGRKQPIPARPVTREAAFLTAAAASCSCHPDPGHIPEPVPCPWHDQAQIQGGKCSGDPKPQHLTGGPC